MLKRIFTEHPESVGESYTEHFHTASGYGVAMLVGGIACLVHAVLPPLFETTGSRTIHRLSQRLVKGRAAQRTAEAEARSGWVI